MPLILVGLNLALLGPGLRLPLRSGRVVMMDGHPTLELTEGPWGCSQPAEELPPVYSLIVVLTNEPTAAINLPTVATFVRGELQWNQGGPGELMGYVDAHTPGLRRYRARGGFLVPLCEGVTGLEVAGRRQW